MFGLFKRNKKIANWQIELLVNTISKLPTEYSYLEQQVKEGLFKKISTKKTNNIPGYVHFTYDTEVLNKFENLKERYFTITDIKVFDIKSQTQLLYMINVADGIILGYAIQGADDFEIDVNKIDVSGYKKVYRVNEDFNSLAKVLTHAEADLLNPTHVYQVVLEGKTYYHLEDLEDGDFIGIDEEKVIYKITHDPFEIIPVNGTLAELYQD